MRHPMPPQHATYGERIDSELPTSLAATDRCMPRYWIPAHIRVCAFAGCSIVLDLRNNRYMGIGAEEAQALRRTAVNVREACWSSDVLDFTGSGTGQDVIDSLVSSGLLVCAVAAEDIIPTYRIIKLDETFRSIGHELETKRCSLSIEHSVALLKAYAWVRHALRYRSPYAIAKQISQLREPGAVFDLERAISLVTVFRRLRPYAFGVKERCLLHALVLIRFLAFFSVFPAWVIGVRASPWGAHSWVQYDSVLFDCKPEDVCEYSPILVV